MTETQTTRLTTYINEVLPDNHGHQRKGILAFVVVLINAQSCCQAALARGLGNFEAACKRLSRLIHNPRLKTEAIVLAHAAWMVARLPASALFIRIAIDWTSEGKQHLLTASLLIGHRAVPLFWKAYSASSLKDHMTEYELAFLTLLITTVLKGVDKGRIVLTLDRGFGKTDLMDLLENHKVGYIIRAKGNVKVQISGGEWQKLGRLRFSKNQRKRSFGRVMYCEQSPRRVWLTQARARDRKGKWGIWYLISNRDWKADTATREYAYRFGCEEGFRDCKRLLGFADAKIKDIEAWERMFLLVAIALLMLVVIGQGLLRNQAWLKSLLRQVQSRRKKRSELSLVRCVTELLKNEPALWDLLISPSNFNLEASL
jgi:hypothetical protein